MFLLYYSVGCNIRETSVSGVLCQRLAYYIMQWYAGSPQLPWPGPLIVAPRTSASCTYRHGPPPPQAVRRPRLATIAATPRALLGDTLAAAAAEEAHEEGLAGARGKNPLCGAVPPHGGWERGWSGKGGSRR
jgi:hypothetical protein